MIVSLIILSALLIVGGVLYLLDRRDRAHEGDAQAEENTESTEQEAECCGMHITCERDSLMAAISDKIEYYDDEELDAYAGRAEDAYEDHEIDEFRDVLLTLRPDDIAGWARSIQLRGITLPSAVRDELLLIVSEERASRAQT